MVVPRGGCYLASIPGSCPYSEFLFLLTLAAWLHNLGDTIAHAQANRPLLSLRRTQLCTRQPAEKQLLSTPHVAHTVV